MILFFLLEVIKVIDTNDEKKNQTVAYKINPVAWFVKLLKLNSER